MDKLKMILKDNTFIRHTFFIVFNAILLYILYFLIKNIGSITGGLHHGFLVLTDAFKPLLIGLVPVSYTHLDVYKRQHLK